MFIEAEGEPVMRKRLLDLNPAKTVEWIHEYIRFELEFGDFYGNNLDALYDALTSITEDTCIGVFCQPKDDSKLSVYLEKVKKVIKDAEQDNMHLCVIFGDMEENYEAD